MFFAQASFSDRILLGCVRWQQWSYGLVPRAAGSRHSQHGGAPQSGWKIVIARPWSVKQIYSILCETFDKTILPSNKNKTIFYFSSNCNFCQFSVIMTLKNKYLVLSAGSQQTLPDWSVAQSFIPFIHFGLLAIMLNYQAFIRHWNYVAGWQPRLEPSLISEMPPNICQKTFIRKK